VYSWRSVQPAKGTRLGPYEIVVLLGAGGMGEVYRARDLNLGRDIAIKLLPGEITEAPERLRRFEQEARAASALNHPNIVTIYEIGHAEGRRYIAMELIEGSTLRALIGSRPLPTKRALQIAAQAADALAKAHDAGIVHRDLKPENIMVTKDGLVKILDFGLAKLPPTANLESAATTELGTTPGVVLGTVGYMSPEQARGRSVDFRSDQFSFGAILYEMATGKRAFQSDSPVQTLSAIIEDQPEPIASLNPSCPPPFRWIIERCLAKEPETRFGSTRDLSRGVEDVLSHLSEVGSSPSNPPLTLPADWQRLRRSPWALLGLVAVACAAAGAVFLLREGLAGIAPRASPAAIASPVKARRSVAVLGFRNLSARPETAWLSTALSEMLTTELAAGGALRTIPGENVGRMKMELSVSEAESLAADTLAKVGRNLGADMVLLGSYLLQPAGQARVDLRLQDVAAGETIVAMAETGTEAGLVDLVSRAGSRLRQAIGVSEPPAAEVGVLRAGVPASLEAQRLYAEGLAKLRVLDALAAKELLLQAVAADPNAPLVHSALAEAWLALGYDNNARDEARKAFERSQNLSREERLTVEARYRVSAREWSKAIEIHRALFAFFPDNLEYGLRLASAQSSAGLGKEALQTLATLRALLPPAASDPRIDLTEAIVAQSLSDFRRQQAAASRAAAKSETQGARLLVARARILEAYAFNRLGELTKGLRAAEDAHRIYQEAGDRGGMSAALNRIGGGLYQRGELIGARKTWEESLAIRRQIGYRHGVASTLGNLGLLLWQQGDLAGAIKAHREAAAIDRELGDKAAVASHLDNMSLALYAEGDLAAAKKRCEEALAICRELGDRALAAAILTTMGQTLASEGDLAGARAKYQDALPVLLESGSRTYAAVALSGLGQLLAAEGDLSGARKKHDEALAIRSELGERISEAESRLALGSLSIEEGRPGEADAVARAAAELFARQKATDKEATAHAVLARSELEQGRPAEALQAAERAAALAAKSQSPELRLAVAVTAARVQAGNGRVGPASKALAGTLAEAEKLGFVALRLEAQLALGEIEMRAGRIESGRARLTTLEKDAKQRGYGLVSRKAATALSLAAAR